MAFWQAAVVATGACGVGAFVIYSLYKQWLSLPVFQTMTKEQQFSLFRLFLILTFCFAVIASGIYAYVTATTRAA